MRHDKRKYRHNSLGQRIDFYVATKTHVSLQTELSQHVKTVSLRRGLVKHLQTSSLDSSKLGFDPSAALESDESSATHLASLLRRGATNVNQTLFD
ncbi:hypothetical protein RRG08_016669 [Elysia crispata]|uniref:Uncharacterized protein n=1 Tax=Elysia crispata TaxID=231223 RepID=A0AAE0XRY0_9GAST|nr:hypothetical protein RRG08_016669 [Elysia crispata]